MATLGLSEAEREAVARLEREVIEPSMTNLVLLDFWAEWCGPCKQLGPVLDKIAADYADKGVRLVKIDVDADKLIAAQFRVQSIPTVYAFYQGQPVADLTNYRTEAQLTRIVDQLIAQLGVGGEAAPPQADLGPLMAIANREGEEARTLLEGVSPELASQAPVARARAALEMASAGSASEAAELEKAVAANPDDLQARFDLAGAKMASGDRDRAADELLAIIERDRDWNDGAARKRLLQLIEAQGIEDQWARAQRRRLSALLFT